MKMAVAANFGVKLLNLIMIELSPYGKINITQLRLRNETSKMKHLMSSKYSALKKVISRL
jgi:hypothetical protein